MKKHVYFLLLLCMSILLCSCQNKLQREVDELRKELDTQRQLLESLQKGTTVYGIEYTDSGYIIVLSNNSRIVLDNNNTPIISLGTNGTWLLNGKDTGITASDNDIPEVTIGANKNWFIDGHDTGVASFTGEAGIVNVIRTANDLVFTFSDGTQITLSLDDFANKDENDFCLPKYLYFLSGTPDTVFVEPFMKRWRPQTEYIRFGGSVPYDKQTPRYAIIGEAQTWQTFGVTLYNENLDVVKNSTSLVRVGDQGVGSEEVTVQIIGDSYTQGAFFKDALLTKGYVPNIKMIGLRKVVGFENQYDEGRGGDRLQDYFDIHTGETKAYQGFMHPDGNRHYYGATGFWINCHKVMNGNTGLEYTCGRFDDAATRFNPETGYLLAPKAGDVQYDNKQASFVEYDGKQWNKVKKDDFQWSFNYKKYLEAWNLPAPKFLAEMLGLNDFRYNIKADFTTWNNQIEIMKRSYLEAVPDGKFMILTPCSTCGVMNNTAGEFTVQQNAAMWRVRKNIIDTFDNREEEGLYIVDTALAIDNENGYRKNEQGMQTGNPHPYLSYPAMGVPIAAFIQYHRVK